MANSLRAGVIGVGHLGRHHARVYSQLPGVDLAAVVDIRPEQAQAIGDEFGAPSFESYEAVLDSLDAVSVVVPTKAHFQIAKAFLEAGVSVLVEKPMTSTLAEADELVETARRTGTRLQVGHIERFNPAVMAIQPYLHDPGYIECVRISPYPFRSVDVGVVMDLMIHDLDIVLHLVDSPVERVEAIGLPVLSNTEDIANARIVFRSGCVANLTASRVALGKVRRIRVFQPDAYVSLDYDARQARLMRRAADFSPEKVAAATQKVAEGASAADVFADFLEVEDIAIGDHEPLAKELESFIHCIRTGEPPTVSGEHGRRALSAAMRVVEALSGSGLPAGGETPS